MVGPRIQLGINVSPETKRDLYNLAKHHHLTFAAIVTSGIALFAEKYPVPKPKTVEQLFSEFLAAKGLTGAVVK